jgi:hypothetical protein
MNYKLDLHIKEYGITRSLFQTEYISDTDTLAKIVKSPIIKFYTINETEIHLKGQVVESKLLQVLFK